MQLIRKIYNLYLVVLLIPIVLKNFRNSFIRDLYTYCLRNGILGSSFKFLYFKYRRESKTIDNLLYERLCTEDKELFLRWLLKRYCGVNSALKQEIEIIDQANEQAKILYRNRKAKDEPICFQFKKKNVFLKTQTPLICNDSTQEDILMNYYNYTHTFVLQEYVLEGYNPNDGETIFDCGAANGDTMLFFRNLYPRSKIHSFEYEELNFKLAQENMQLNNVENVILNKVFLYSDTKKHNLELDTYKILDDECSKNKKLIQTQSIDDYVWEKNILDIGLIKMDIEGGELEALKGAVETIKRQKPLLYIPIYHLDSDIYKIPIFLNDLGIPMSFRIKWTEKKVWGMDCVLFVKFNR